MDRGHVHLREQTDPRRIEALVDLPGRGEVELFIEANVTLRQSPEAWLPVVTLMAMWSRRPLGVEGPVDEVLLKNLDAAQTLLTGWWPDTFGVVDIVAAPVAAAGAVAGAVAGVGCFFSGGVDSFYSVLRHRTDLTHLVFVHGFDIPLDDTGLAARTASELRTASAVLELPLVEVRTNIRDLAEGELDWGVHAHGAALAAVGHALVEHVSTVLIASSYHVDKLIWWGTHPDLDPLWSSSSTSFVHDGVEATRPAKVRLLVDHPVAMDHLRVCWRNPDGAYNCGECEKCLRTMLNLLAAGALGRCRTMPDHLDPRVILRMRRVPDNDRSAAENIAALMARRGARRYGVALRLAVLRMRLRLAGERVRDALKRSVRS